jgi:PAS domain S-box-containing protein/diguanylate cyclase (GGDEF)-like protein
MTAEFANTLWTHKAVIEQRRLREELTACEVALHRAQVIAKLAHLISGVGGEFESWSETLPLMIGEDAQLLPNNMSDWRKLIHPDDLQLFIDKERQAGDTQARTDLAYRLHHANGTWLNVLHVIEPLQGLTGSNEGSGSFLHTIRDLTESQRAEDALKESNRRFNDMLSNVKLATVMLDRDAKITYCNDHLLQVSGWNREEVIGKNWFDVFMPPEHGDVRPIFQALLSNLPEAWHRDQDLFTKSGARRHFRWNNSVLRSESGHVIGIASIGEDVTERIEAETKIYRLNRVYAVLSGINSLIVRATDRATLFRESCRIAVEHGQLQTAFIGIVDNDACKLIPVAAEGAPPDFLTTFRDAFPLDENLPDGATICAQAVRAKMPAVCNDVPNADQLACKPIIEARGTNSVAMLPLMIDGEVVGVLALYSMELGFFDSAEMKLLTELTGDIAFAIDHIEKAEKINYLAYYDQITGLPNVTLFLERIDHHLRTHGQTAGQLAIVLVKIERFGFIVETLGRQAGDQLLNLVAQRLRASSIEVDTIARAGANFFGIVMPHVFDAGSVAFNVEQLINACFDKSFRVSESDLRIAGKAGISLYPNDGADAETLLRNADAALKRTRGTVELMQFYSPEMNVRIAEALDLENKLRIALDMHQFVLHYQPKINLATGKLVGAEALIRWNDPQTGLVPPARFIPILEETGLIYEVGRWALRTAVADYLRWRSAGLDPVRIAVNVSPLQLRHHNFVAEIEEVLGISSQASFGLELEITESQIMVDMERNISSLLMLRSMGVSIAIDDFGTGYSSLAHLAKLPVDSLKIDRSFIVEMTDTQQGLALVSTIINLAHGLNLKVVAEGVETEDQLRILRSLNCDEMQGFLFSRPVSADIFEAQFLRHGGVADNGRD